MTAYDINARAYMHLLWNHKPKYFDPPTIRVNTPLPTGRTFTPKEYYEFLEDMKNAN
jgi:hypothetical protein